MTAQIIELQRQPRVMECMGCCSEEFLLRSDRRIVCAGCGGMARLRWVPTSNQPPMGEESDDGE